MRVASDTAATIQKKLQPLQSCAGFHMVRTSPNEHL